MVGQPREDITETNRIMLVENRLEVKTRDVVLGITQIFFCPLSI